MAQEVTYDPTLMDTLDEDMTTLPAEFDPDEDYKPPLRPQFPMRGIRLR